MHITQWQKYTLFTQHQKLIIATTHWLNENSTLKTFKTYNDPTFADLA